MTNKMKGRPFKEQASYFWQYYKWHTIIALMLLSYAIYGICAIAGKKEAVLNGIFLDSYEKADFAENLADDFAEIVPIDDKNEEYQFRTDLFYDLPKVTMRKKYQANQIISSQTMNGKLDFVISDTSTMTSFVQRTMLADLTTFFSEDELALLQPYLIYVDKADLDKQAEISLSDTKAMTAAFNQIIPSSKDPSTMKEPIPVLLDVSHCERIRDLYTYTDEDLAFGIAQNTAHPETTKKFLAYLLQ